MDGSHLTILSRAAALAHAPATDPARRTKRLLRLLRRSLALEEVLLQFRSGAGRRFDVQLTACGAALVTPAISASPPVASSHPSQSVAGSPGILSVPVKRGRRLVGVLFLYGAPPSLGGDSDLLKGVAALLAWLLGQLRFEPEFEASQLHDLTLLFGLSQCMYSTLKLDEQMLLLLAGLTLRGREGFERAMLFMVNERSGMLQGMLGVTRDAAVKVFPQGVQALARGGYELDRALLKRQQGHPFSQRVRQQRLRLDPENNALGKAAMKKRVVFVDEPLGGTPQATDLALELGLSGYACLPLAARDRCLAVVVVDNPRSGRPPQRAQKSFLELFARQAGQALENALLVQRLEGAHDDLRTTQEQLIQGERLAAVGEMAASVAHELKNPLVVIGGFARRLERKVNADSLEHRYAQTIAREVERLEKMLANILAFSKENLLCLSNCDLAQIVDDAIALGRGSDEPGEIRYEVELQSNLPSIQGDEQQLRQVLMNLLLNAKEAVKGHGSVYVKAYRGTLRAAAAVVLEVADSGGGIPPQVLRNIFNPFFTTRSEGTGLGLSIVQRIVEQHHGDIEVHNGMEGAQFKVFLPLCPPRSASSGAQHRFGDLSD